MSGEREVFLGLYSLKDFSMCDGELLKRSRNKLCSCLPYLYKNFQLCGDGLDHKMMAKIGTEGI